MPLHLACLGGHGRVRVGEERAGLDTLSPKPTDEPILRCTLMSRFCLLRPRNEKRTGKFMAKIILCCLASLATPILWQLQGHYKGSSVDRRTGLFPLNDTLRSWMEALSVA